MIYTNNLELPWQNKIFISGSVMQDPKVIQTKGNYLISFSIEQDEKTKMGVKTTHHNVIFFTNKPEVAERLKKGTDVFVAGKLEYRSFEDKNGNRQTKAQVSAYLIDQAGKVYDEDSL
jgi:single-strand DNA-binding protein